MAQFQINERLKELEEKMIYFQEQRNELFRIRVENEARLMKQISERDELINEKNQIIEDLTRQLEDQKEDSDGHRRRAEKAENDYRKLLQNDQFFSMLRHP
jgi:hypothetical protein